MSNGTLKINDKVVAASEFAYDGCHKIYLIIWGGDREAMLERLYRGRHLSH